MVGAAEDLAPFSAYLWQQRVPHRVFEERGMQVLEVARAVDADQVRDDYAAWRDGRLQLQLTRTAAPRGFNVRTVLHHYPVLIALMVVTLANFPAAWGMDASGIGSWLRSLTIAPIDAQGAYSGPVSLGALLAAAQWWRLVTPIFIHFGLAHLLFNVAVVVEFGRRIERSGGSWLLLGLTLVIAVCSNVAQFLISGAALFGGLSGVAYGLLAYVVVRGRFDGAPAWHVNRSFVVSVLLILVVMSSGITQLFGLYLANTAHWAGLGTGAGLALLWRPTRDVTVHAT
jgi:GlpG protein